MAVLNRAAVTAPVVPKQTVEVPALGGEVVVRGLMMTERLALQSQMASLAAQARVRTQQGDGYDAASDLNSVLPMLLAMVVLDAEGQQLYSAEQWNVFGGQHPEQAVALFNVAWDLAGFAADLPKN